MVDFAIISTTRNLPADDDKTWQERRKTLQPTVFNATDNKECQKQEKYGQKLVKTEKSTSSWSILISREEQETYLRTMINMTETARRHNQPYSNATDNNE